MDEQIRKWLEVNVKMGYSDGQIKEALLKANLSPSLLDDYRKMQSMPTPPSLLPPPPAGKKMETGNLSATKIPLPSQTYGIAGQQSQLPPAPKQNDPANSRQETLTRISQSPWLVPVVLTIMIVVIGAFVYLVFFYDASSSAATLKAADGLVLPSDIDSALPPIPQP